MSVNFPRIAAARTYSSDVPGISILGLFVEANNRHLDEVLELARYGELTIKKPKRKKSFSSLGYLWVLCDDIANVLNSTKKEVYRRTVASVGVFTPLKVTERAYPRFKQNWEGNGAGWFIIEANRSGGYVEANAYCGVSTYTQEELNRVLDELITEAEGLGIDTLASKYRRVLTRKEEAWK